MPISRRLPLPAPFLGGIALGLVAALAWSSLAAGQGPDQPAIADRASIEKLLAQRAIQPTGQTRPLELTVAETEWELLPGVTTTTTVAFNGTVPGPEIRVITQMPGMESMPGMDP